MKIEKTSLDGVVIVEPDFRFEDRRGEVVCALEDEFGRWKKHNFAVSYKNVLRGIHVSPSRAKLAYCPFGSVYVVAVDCRPGLASFGKWLAVNMGGTGRKMIYVPPMFGLAHLVRSQVAVFYYHWSGAFDADEQISYRWDSFGIEWPISEPPILSERDEYATFLYFKRETSGFSDAPSMQFSEHLRKMAEEDQR